VAKLRKIIHLDLDAFFCAVEELRDPALRGKPFAVGGQPSERGVVASCSYPARRKGVHSAMPMSQAVQLCPEMMIIPSSHSIYSEVSEQVMEILADVTPLLEQISIDEAFLDVSDLPEPGIDLARSIQNSIHLNAGLPCSLGVASNKLMAKIATDQGKACYKGMDYPNAILVVPPGEEAAFLAPLAVGALWGVGPKSAARLGSLGIHTIGELANASEALLTRMFGKAGADFHRHALGIDDRPVSGDHELKSISQEITFEKDVASAERLLGTLQDLSDQVGYRLRKQGLCAGVIRIKIRWPDFSTHTRQCSLPTGTDQDGVIFSVVKDLFTETWPRGAAVRLLGVAAANLEKAAHQPELWETPDDRERRLLSAVDILRQKYGKKVIQRGRALKK
jgi:DNA polymerase-4